MGVTGNDQDFMGALEHPDIANRCDMKEHAGLLHLSIEAARSNAGNLYFGVRQALQPIGVVGVDGGLDVRPRR